MNSVIRIIEMCFYIDGQRPEAEGLPSLDNVRPTTIPDSPTHQPPLSIIKLGFLIITVVRVDTVSGNKGWQLFVFTTNLG